MAAPSGLCVLSHHWYRSGRAAKLTGLRGVICSSVPRSVLRSPRVCRGERGSVSASHATGSPHVTAPPRRRDRIPPAGGQGMTQVHRWRAFAVLAVSFFMTVADLAIVNVALPTIGRDLHMAESSLQWVVTGYALTFGGFLLLGGRAADLLGRRRILMAGLFLFTAASLGCGLATADSFLISMRFVQGIGAAIVLP